MAPKFRAIVFDFDGTLVESNAIKEDAFLLVAKSLNVAEAAMREVLAKRGPKSDRFEVWRNVSVQLSRPELAEEGARLYSEHCLREVTRAPMIEGAQDLLENLLSARCPLYINSATPEQPLRETVAARDMSKYFREVYGFPVSKEEHLLEILKREQILDPRELLMIGDGRDDLKAAEEIGTSFLLRRSPGREISYAGKSFVSFYEIADLIL
jgi:phosphoglycolate phosphatase